MRVKKITSRSNAEFRKLLRLLSGKGIRKYGLGLLSGPKQVRDVITCFPDRCTGLVMPIGMDCSQFYVPPSIRIYQLGPDLFREIDASGTNYPILMVRVERFPVWSFDHWPQGCTLFIPFQDPINVGAVIRSAAAFDVTSVVIMKEAAHPFHPKSMRTAGSHIFRVSLFEGPSIRQIKESQVPLLVLSPEGIDVGHFTFPKTFGLIPGMEGPGIPDELKQLKSLRIPMAPDIDSLNAATATGIALYLWKKGCSASSQFPS